MAKCPKCEREIPNDASFCPYCGVTLEKIISSTQEERKTVQVELPMRTIIKFVIDAVAVVVIVALIFSPIIPYTYYVKEPYQVNQPHSENIWSDQNIVLPKQTYTWKEVNIPEGRTIVFEFQANNSVAEAYVFSKSNYDYWVSNKIMMPSYSQSGSSGKITFTTVSYILSGDLYFVLTNGGSTGIKYSVSISSSWEETVTEYNNVANTKYVSLFEFLTGVK